MSVVHESSANSACLTSDRRFKNHLLPLNSDHVCWYSFILVGLYLAWVKSHIIMLSQQGLHTLKTRY